MPDLLNYRKLDTLERQLVTAPTSTVVRFVDDVKRRIGHGPAHRFARNFFDDVTLEYISKGKVPTVEDLARVYDSNCRRKEE